ncbi:hypothetical protein [Frankia tisae]|uniref:hypothetical protein n=1 Tax=Frankia tisae TaxID=2950104 RepID=UPI0021BFB709|nr:hypothetical protein [Frankia tisae]
MAFRKNGWTLAKRDGRQRHPHGVDGHRPGRAGADTRREPADRGHLKNTVDGTQPLATALTTNVGKLSTLVKTVGFTPLIMTNGAKSLLDEVAKSKVTGEEW